MTDKDLTKGLLAWINRDSPGRPCSNWCRHYKEAWIHRDNRCVLSDVFSTTVGNLCHNGQEKKI